MSQLTRRSLRARDVMTSHSAKCHSAFEPFISSSTTEAISWIAHLISEWWGLSFQDRAGVPGRIDCSDRSEEVVQRWTREQEVQRLLAQTPPSLVGERVEIYRQEGTTRFYTAFITSCNDQTKVRVTPAHKSLARGFKVCTLHSFNALVQGFNWRPGAGCSKMSYFYLKLWLTLYLFTSIR